MKCKLKSENIFQVTICNTIIHVQSHIFLPFAFKLDYGAGLSSASVFQTKMAGRKKGQFGKMLGGQKKKAAIQARSKPSSNIHSKNFYAYE